MLYVGQFVFHNAFVVVEKILVDATPTEEPNIGIVRDRSIGKLNAFQVGALRLGFHRSNDIRNSEETQQILNSEMRLFKIPIQWNLDCPNSQ